MNGTGHRRLGVLLGTVGLAALLASGGCSADRAGDRHSAGAAGAPVAKPPGPADPDKPGAPQPGQQGGADLRVDQRSIVYTGSIDVRVEDVDQAAARAATIATTAGGFVGGDNRTSTGTSAEATLQLRVPAAKFSSVVDQLAGLGESQRREINTQDVTEESIDLNARIGTQRARVESGRRLLSQAKSLDDLIMLEGEVAKREADLASLEAKQRQMNDLTALSTITVALRTPDRKPADVPERSKTGFLPGLKAGWASFTGALRILLTVLGALLPWLVAFGVPVLGLLWLLRHRRRTRPVPPLATPAAPAPPFVDGPG